MVSIRSIALKSGAPFVKYDQGAGGNSTISSVYPGAGSDPVPPTIAFDNAINNMAAAITAEYSLAVDWEWRLENVALLWDEEDGEYGFSAKLSAFLKELGKQDVAIKQQSPSHVPQSIRKAIEVLEKEAIAFVRGASAQGNLFAVNDGDLVDAA